MSTLGPSASQAGGESDVETMVADLDEFEECLEALELEELNDEEAHALAVEAQKLGKKMHRFHNHSKYKTARDAVRRGKTNRGWSVSTTSEGQFKVDSKAVSEKMKSLKKRTKCFACGQTGHWNGDSECSKKKAHASRYAQPGGFIVLTLLKLVLHSLLA